MSRLAKTPIKLPKGVEVKLPQEHLVEVKGPKGHLNQQLMRGIEIQVEGDELLITSDEKLLKNGKFLGLHYALIRNMVQGVSTGFEKELNLIGVGFKAQLKGNKLELQLGFSHPTEMVIPEGIQVKVDKAVTVLISGIDKQKVGLFAAQVRALRPPEPYKGKGVRYKDEYVRKKAGKAAAKAK